MRKVSMIRNNASRTNSSPPLQIVLRTKSKYGKIMRITPLQSCRAIWQDKDCLVVLSIEITRKNKTMLENILESSDGLRTWLQNLLMSWHLPEWTFNTIDFSLQVLAMWALSYLAYFLNQEVLHFYTLKLVQITKTKYDGCLNTRQVFHRFSQLPPGLLI